jgi:hypothetical protein
VGAHVGPKGAKLSPNTSAVILDARGGYYYATPTRTHGWHVWRGGQPQHNLLDDVPPEHEDELKALFGAAMLHWRPTDGALLLSSVNAAEDAIVTLPIPGVWFWGRPYATYRIPPDGVWV